MTDKKAYADKLSAEIEKWDSEIGVMRAKAKSASADARIEYDRQINDLEKRRDELDAKLDELRNSSGNAWDDIKDGVDRAWKNMSSAVQNATDRF
jgi:chromosome segregation ATPase